MFKKVKLYLNLRNIIVLLALAIVLGFLVGAPIYYFTQKDSKVLSAKISDPEQDLTTDEIDQLVKKIGVLVVLPEGERPEIATVSNVEKLQNQSFFVNAQNGDKVLVYLKAKKAYLYRPSLNRVVDIAPVNLPSPAKESNNTTPIPTPQITSSKVPLVIYNGSGDAKKLSDDTNKLEELDSLDIQGSRNAENKYQDTVVIDLTGENTKLVTDIVTAIGGKASNLVPAGEQEPTGAGILVILGGN